MKSGVLQFLSCKAPSVSIFKCTERRWRDLRCICKDSLQRRLMDAQLCMLSPLDQQRDNLQIQTKVSLLVVEPSYGLMSSHLYLGLRNSSHTCTSLRTMCVEKLKNRAQGSKIRAHDIAVCCLCSLIWPTSMKALAKTTRQLASRNAFSRPSFKQSSVSFGGLFDSPTQANPEGLVRNGIA